MSLPVLRKIRDLVNAGAVVVGTQTDRSPSLSDDQARVAAHRRPALGDSGKVTLRQRSRFTNAGHRPDSDACTCARLRVHASRSPTRTSSSCIARWPDGEIYWVNNRRIAPRRWTPPSASRARQPSLASRDGQPGARRLSHCRRTNDRATSRSMPTRPCSWCFAKPATAPSRTAPRTARDGSPHARRLVARRFPARPRRARDDHARQLASWSENADPGVKYFSGTATYTKTLRCPCVLV